MDDGYQSDSKPTRAAVTDRIWLGDGVPQPANCRRRSGITDWAHEIDDDVIGALSRHFYPRSALRPKRLQCGCQRSLAR